MFPFEEMKNPGVIHQQRLLILKTTGYKNNTITFSVLLIPVLP